MLNVCKEPDSLGDVHLFKKSHGEPVTSWHSVAVLPLEIVFVDCAEESETWPINFYDLMLVTLCVDKHHVFLFG